MRVRYSHGSRRLVVVGGLLVLTADPALAGRAWDAATGGADADALLVEFVRGGFAALGPFALVELTGRRARVIVRGDLPTEVRTADGVRQWSGTGLTTWAEHTIDGVQRIVIGGETGRGADSDVEWLPLGEGVVRCGGVQCGEFDLAAQPASRPADTPVRMPAPGGDPDRPEVVRPALRTQTWTPDDEPGSVPVGGPPVIDPPPPPPAPRPASVPARPAVPAMAAGRPPVTLDPAQTRTDDPEDGFDHLWGSTVMRSVEDAAIREPTGETMIPGAGAALDAPTRLEPVGSSAGAGPARLGDHDGFTISASGLDVLRRQAQAGRPDPVPGPSARLELSTGDVVTLDRDVVIGRRPQVDNVHGGHLPTVVTVPSPQQDVSRTHLRIGWSAGRVRATDLNSKNGTVLISADGRTGTLPSGAPHSLDDGDTLDLGDGITVVLRLAPGNGSAK